MPSTTNLPTSFLFSDHSSLAEIFRGKRVAVVGSGPGSLDNPVGFVDSHDVVVRVNNHKCIPNSGTGMRTDVHFSFYGISIKKTAGELLAEGVKLCIAKCPNAKFMDSEWHRRRRKMFGTDFRYIYKNRERFWFCPTYVPTVDEFVGQFELLQHHIPTTGFAAVLQILSCQPANCFVTGMDFFQTGLHNVNEQWKAGDPSDPIGHRADLEREWFLNNLEHQPITMDALLSQAIAGRIALRVQRVPQKGARRLVRRAA